VWYRYCRLIIAGKEHIIKKIIGYFAEQGIGQVDLDYLQHNLNTLDKNNLLPARIELTQKDGVYIGVFFGDKLYEDFLKFQEKVDALYGEYRLRQKTKEQKELQKKEIEFVPGKISVYPCNSVNDTIKYGVGTIWCISQPGNGNYYSYRHSSQSTFYYVQDNTRQSDDPLSRVMVDIQANGVVSLTDINNRTGTIAEFGTDWKKYFEYLEKNGVDISQFVNKPMTEEEEEENNLIGKEINDLEKFEKLSSEYKFKYIGRGHLLTTEQLKSILEKKSVHSNDVKNTLIKHYLSTGRSLPAFQKIILFESNQGWRTTYIRRREIAIDQIKKHFQGDDEKIGNYAIRTKDNEITNTNNLYEDPLKSTNIVVDNIKDFDFLLNKGVSSDQFDWYEISKIPDLPENLIRQFKDKVSWAVISRSQKLSGDFIREFKDKIEETKSWNNIFLGQTLSEDFIREFQDKVSWDKISKYQKLSEDFIREFEDKVNWDWISWNQKLSEDFIREFQDKVDWYDIQQNKNIPKETKHNLKAQGFPIKIY